MMTANAGIVATQLVLFDNDAVDVSFTDGSRLQMSPCASAFAHHQPPGADVHPIHGVRTTKQRTAFVTSAFQDVVAEAVNFRNRFADQPFLSAKLGDYTEMVRLHTDIFEVAWPDDIDAVVEYPDGSLSITSADEYACITLAAHRHTFTAQFLSKVSEHADKRLTQPLPPVARVNSSLDSQSEASIHHELSTISHITGHSGHLALTDSINELRLDARSQLYGENTLDKSKSSNIGHPQDTPQTNQSKHSYQSQPQFGTDQPVPRIQTSQSGASRVGNESGWNYKWVSQNHSILSYPENWKHPVELLLQYRKDKIYEQYGFSEENRHGKKDRGLKLKAIEKKTLKNCVYAPLPRSLPLNCSNSHMHKWKADVTDNADDLVNSLFVQCRIKVICLNGYIYRFIWTSPRTLEVFPGDGTVMKSCGLVGKFFQHMVYVNGKVEERMYSVDAPPPNVPGMPYSVPDLIKKAARFFSLMHASDNVSASPACYSAPVRSGPTPGSAPTPAPLEECVVGGLGKFSAHSSGRVRVLFQDRTALDMVADFSPRLNACSRHSEESGPAMPRLLRPMDIPEGTCRLMLPNGHYITVDLQTPGQYKRYVEAAQDWVAWVNTPTGQRKDFYKDTIYDPQKALDIQAELKKINCFNYIMENGVKPRVNPVENLPPSGRPDMDDAILEDPFTNKPLPAQAARAFRNVAKPSPGEDFDLAMVHDILRRTSQTVQDLDQYLAVNGEMKPTKN